MTAADDRTALERLNDASVEDILATSDETILAEVRQDGQDPERIAAVTRELFEKAILHTNKLRLLSAQAAVAAARLLRSRAVISTDPEMAWRRLQHLLTQLPRPLARLRRPLARPAPSSAPALGRRSASTGDKEIKAVPASVYFSSDVGNPDTYTKFYSDLQMYTIGLGQRRKIASVDEPA